MGPPPGAPKVQMMGENDELHPRLMASPLGYATANSVVTAWDVATRNAAARFPEAQYPTRALAASSALGCGAGGSADAAVVGTGTVVGTVVVAVVVVVVVVVLDATVVVGRVVGADAGEAPQAVAVTPRTAVAATARTDRARKGVTIPL